MKRVIALTLALFLVAGVAYGQTPYRTGDLGLLFAFRGLDNLGVNGYQGGIGAKMFLGGLAIRPMVEFGSYSEEEAPFDPTNVGETFSDFTMGLGADVLIYLATGKISPYVGLGGGFESTKLKTEYEHAQNTTPDTYEETSFTLQFGVILGAELFIANNLSLSGEYQLGYGSVSMTDKATSGATGISVEAESSASFMGVDDAGYLILTVYF